MFFSRPTPRDPIKDENVISIRELTPALKKRAKQELNEDPKRISSDIQALQHWVSKQPHLHSVKTSEQWLIAFLRGCKFSLERSKQKIDMYYTLRSIVPDLFSDRDPMSAKIQEMLGLGLYLPLRGYIGEDGPRPCILRLGLHDAGRFHLGEIIKLSLMITEILMLEDDNFVIAGEEFILDMKNVGLSLIAQFTPALAKKVTACMEKGLPIRQRSIHMLHTPPGFETVFNIFKSFISEKLKKRVKVHNLNYDAFHKDVPKSVLPAEYGGVDGNLQELIDHWKNKVESYRDWFLKEEQCKSDETLRPGKPKSTTEMFGLEGSFRKLEFD